MSAHRVHCGLTPSPSSQPRVLTPARPCRPQAEPTLQNRLTPPPPRPWLPCSEPWCLRLGLSFPFSVENFNSLDEGTKAFPPPRSLLHPAGPVLHAEVCRLCHPLVSCFRTGSPSYSPVSLATSARSGPQHDEGTFFLPSPCFLSAPTRESSSASLRALKRRRPNPFLPASSRRGDVDGLIGQSEGMLWNTWQS